jgi:hypothetical protein
VLVADKPQHQISAVNDLTVKRSHDHTFCVVTGADLPLKAKIEIKQPEVEGQGTHED